MEDHEICELMKKYPLDAGWSDPELYHSEVKIDEICGSVYGMAVNEKNRKNVITASSINCEDNLGKIKCYFEMLERVTVFREIFGKKKEYRIIDWDKNVLCEICHEKLWPQSNSPMEWTYSKSNGVAAHTNHLEAYRKALLEVVERDSILRSWLGYSKPRRSASLKEWYLKQLGNHYDFSLYDISMRNEKNPAHVYGLFGFPKNEANPLVYGFGCDFKAFSAKNKAKTECLQRLFFLWGEDIPVEKPAFSPTPDFHQELYLWAGSKDCLTGWLKGQHVVDKREKSHYSKSLDLDTFGFIEITPPHLLGKATVVKAFSSQALPLIFGKYPPYIHKNGTGLHPIA